MEQSKHTGTNKPFGFPANRKIDREALRRTSGLWDGKAGGKREVREQEVEACDTEGLVVGSRKVRREGSLPYHNHDAAQSGDDRWIEHHKRRNVHSGRFLQRRQRNKSDE